ncbi:hypothetical protein GCM10010123_15480 [Pilimelia anulata]|uniref:Uncharacterized protein n=1 Tax=Pilimelia anulata TaxID=53371 RepID=A0A8J3B9F9_9ACTN|nr:hypothetical protein [Pilimelia anulata]GGJ86782.1 hypothetical protein GCM10010123_15480 [Pilimelia anulata]
MRKRAATWSAALLTTALAATGAPGPAAATAPGRHPVFIPYAQTLVVQPAKMARYDAHRVLRRSGIVVWSSGSCMRRMNRMCTSLDGINRATILGAVTLRRASGCGLTVTGGTEVGHELPRPYKYTHWNGYKLDFRLTNCLNRYVTRTFRAIGGSQWRARSGNIYYREPDHWDVTFFNCGGC